MKLRLSTERRIVRLPQQNGAALREVTVTASGGQTARLRIPLAVTGVDSWQYLRLSNALCGAELELTVQDENGPGMLAAAELLTDAQYAEVFGRSSRGAHLHLPFGPAAELKRVYRRPRGWALSFSGPAEERAWISRVIQAENSVFFHASLADEPESGLCRTESACAALSGDIYRSVSVEDDGGRFAIAVCRGKGGDFLSLPYRLREDESVQFHPQLEQLRMWERVWETDGDTLCCPLRFAKKAARWPNISVVEAQGTPDDITAEAFEAELTVPASVEKMELTLPWSTVTLDRANGQLLCGGKTVSLPHAGGELHLRLVFDATATELLCGGQALVSAVCTDRIVRAQSVDNSVSGNLERCALDEVDILTLTMHADRACSGGLRIKVYGLRGLSYSVQALAAREHMAEASRVLYENHAFTLYNDRVYDSCYSLTGAYAAADDIIVSPTRVTEEFVWRDTPWGDMTRADDRGDLWCAPASLRRYPALHTDAVCLNAAWNVALDVFRKCSDSDYAIPGQQDLWAAGVFQGRGESFGVWLRDSAHVALRCGSLIDPDTCLRTLKYAAAKGFDNGSDGPAMLPVSVWDYSLATGNKSVLFELLPELLSNAQAIDNRFDEAAGLVRAAQSTSNDAFPEPETGGFALGSECYFMKAYEALAEIGRETGCGSGQIAHWQSRADAMRRHIRQAYWNPAYGYFTSGPRGSRAYDDGVWETSGIEAAVWRKFGIADERQICSVLDSLPHTAMSPYGIILFPNRPEKNHFVGPVWGVWQAGFAAAAAQTGREALLLQLIAQQTRVALLHKSFYEVLESDSGRSWRWPGQLWHAAGFVSLVLCGLLGVEYDASGMTLHPCVPEQFGDISVERLNYRAAQINVRVRGCGTEYQMRLDGRACDRLPADLEGEHEVSLTAR